MPSAFVGELVMSIEKVIALKNGYDFGDLRRRLALRYWDGSVRKNAKVSASWRQGTRTKGSCSILRTRFRAGP